MSTKPSAASYVPATKSLREIHRHGFTIDGYGHLARSVELDRDFFRPFVAVAIHRNGPEDRTGEWPITLFTWERHHDVDQFTVRLHGVRPIAAF